MTSNSVQASLAVSIKWSLLTAVMLLLVILGGVSFMAQSRLATLGETISLLGRENLPEVRGLGEMQQAMTRIRLTAVRIALATQQDQRQEAQTLLATRLKDFDARLNDRLKAAAEDPRAMVFFSRIASKWRTYIAIQSKLGDPRLATDREALERLVNVESFAAFNEVVGTIEDGIKLANLRADEAVTRAEAERATFSMVLLAVNMISIAIGLATLFFVAREVSLPIRRMTEAMESIAKGNLQTDIPFADRDNELGLMARALAVFRKSLVENERLSAATRTLSELSEWLQSAKSETELYGMISDVLARLMPECKGTLYIYANSRDTLDVATTWNGPQARLSMYPDDCWSLRRGHAYRHGVSETEFRCSHVSHDTPEDYCCIPILAHGETVGLLHLEYIATPGESREERKAKFADRYRLGLACAEHVSIAIANIKLRDELRDRSVRDVLTGLNNRRYLLETGARELARAQRNDLPIGLLSIDVDHFKKFNDNHGHDAGDAVLRSVAECMRSVFREEEIPCRFGGEEFVALLPGADAETTARRAEELRARVEALSVRHAGGQLPRITISIGLASFPDHGVEMTDLLKAADEALYEAKRKGRNRVEVAARTPRAGHETPNASADIPRAA